MSIKENVRIVKDVLAAMGRGDKQGLLELAHCAHPRGDALGQRRGLGTECFAI